MGLALGQTLGDQRGLGDDLLVALILGIQNPHGILVQPVFAVLGQAVLVLTEEGAQIVGIGDAVLGRAQRVDFQLDMGAKAQFGQEPPGQPQHFHIGQGAVHPQKLDAHLMELALTALLRPFVAEHRAAIEQLQRQALRQPARDKGPRHPGRAFGTQGQRFAGPLEAVHFLGDHVRGLAQGARKHLGELEDRRHDLAKAITLSDVKGDALHMAMHPRLVRQQIVGAPHRLQSRHYDPFCASRAAALASTNSTMWSIMAWVSMR